MEERAKRAAALEALEVLVGEWSVTVELAGAPTGRVEFSWALDDQYLVQRSTVPDSDVPDSLAVIAYDDEQGVYTQHYFDSRGVVRLYRMELADGVWRLQRTTPDFSPLTFWQRFEGTFSADGKRIDARWEQSQGEGASWGLDFRLAYERVR